MDLTKVTIPAKDKDLCLDPYGLFLKVPVIVKKVCSVIMFTGMLIPRYFPSVDYMVEDLEFPLGHQLIGFINENILRPLSPPEAVEECFRLDQMIVGWILNSLSKLILSQMEDDQITLEAWNTLETVYGTSTRSRIQKLKSDLHDLQKAIVVEIHPVDGLLPLMGAGKVDLLLCLQIDHLKFAIGVAIRITRQTLLALDDVVQTLLALTIASQPPSTKDEWFLDSGATHNLTPDPTDASSISPYSGNDSIFIGNE
ncbi:hypothetical protein H6P81_015870 [Aristolochia fimbriata]|uniref:Uncharacterized protein n=1 Tax=Aristolochia fimbriata TaxID=158543 RepID=A0AAV7E6P2_ARIFI|nr:hypothetical protein H6P81_015870 [Aristolochia fimbriata]